MEEAMSKLQAEEAAAAAASSSTRGTKRRRRYVNRDYEAAHFRPWHDYFDDDYVYSCPTSVGGIVCGGLFLLSIIHKLSEISSYFCERYDATEV
jgi:hypothetical protein